MRFLHGYVKARPSGRFVGVCLQPNLVVEARTEAEAERKLGELIEAFITDAAKDGTLDQPMTQRAPARFQVEYWIGRLTNILTRSFHSFEKACRIPKHA